MFKISKSLSLPSAAVTERLAFLGRTGQGKSYAAMLLAEQMHAGGAQFVVMDPVGIWWGLRLGKDGKSPGLSIPLLGGLRGDMPIEATGGSVVADAVVDRGTSMIIDLSQFEFDTDRVRFAKEFAKRLFFRKKAAPSALHIFLEESQEFVPQEPGKDETLMLSAWLRIAKIGRNYGFGLSLITQRPQEVNKKALNLTELLFAFQLTGLHERKAVEAWINDKDLDIDVKALLPKLEPRNPHVWSPSWLKLSKVLTISERITFDSSATPEVGAKAKERKLSPIDLKQLQADMAATVERAKAEDPKLLQKRIRELEQQLKTKGAAVDPKALERAEATGEARGRKAAEAENKQLRVVIRDRDGRLERADAFAGKIRDLAHLNGEAAAVPVVAQKSAPVPQVGHAAKLPRENRAQSSGTISAPKTKVGQPTEGAYQIGSKGGDRRMLIALAQNRPGLADKRLSILSGISTKGGTFGTYLSRMQTAGYIQRADKFTTITESGVDALGNYEELPHGAKLIEYWRGKIGGETSGERRMFDSLVDVYPAKLTKPELSEASGVALSGGSFGTYLSRLRTLGLAEGKDEIGASPTLFD